MKIIDRYLMKNLLKIFSAVFFILFGVSFAIEVLMDSTSVIEDGYRFVDLISDSLGFVLEFISTVFSFVLLLSAVITLLILNSRSELTAVRSIGISDWRIARPVFYFFLPLLIGFYINQSYLVPMFRNVSWAQSTNITWHINGNFLIFKSQKGSGNEIPSTVLVLDDDKRNVNSVIYRAENADRLILKVDKESSVPDVSPLFGSDNRPAGQAIKLEFKRMEFLPYETVMEQIITLGPELNTTYLFVMVKKISQILIMLSFVPLSVIITNTPARRYSFFRQILLVLFIWLLVSAGEVIGMRMFEVKKLHWFWGGSMGLWFSLGILGGVWFLLNDSRRSALFGLLPFRSSV